MTVHESPDAGLGILNQAEVERLGDFPLRTSHDILEGVFRGDLHDTPPRPEPMSEAHKVDVVAYAEHPGAYPGKKFYGYNRDQEVVVPYAESLVLPQALSNLVRQDGLAFGRTGVVDLDNQRTPKPLSEMGAGYLYHGKFHGDPDNRDQARDYTILSFPVPSEGPQQLTSCTVVVKGQKDFETVRQQADFYLPKLMDGIQLPRSEGGEGVRIHPAGDDYEIELRPEQTINAPQPPSLHERTDFSESSIREDMEWLAIDTRAAMDIALSNKRPGTTREQIADKVLLAQEWQIQSLLHNSKLSAESVPALREQLASMVRIDNDTDLGNWVGERGIAKATINEIRADEAARITPSFPEDAVKPRRQRRLFGGKKDRGGEQSSTGDGDELAFPEENAVGAVKVATQKDRKPEPRGLKAFHRAMAALELKRTEMIVGGSVEKSHRRVRRMLGAGALALTGVAGAYLAFRSGGPLHGFGTAVADKLGDTSVGHGLAPGANGELIPSTGGVGGQIPSDIPQTPSTHFGTEIMPPSGGTGAVTPPDQIPGTPQVPTPDVPKPGTGTFDPNAIGITTPDTNTLPVGDFHLNPGQSLSEYIRAQMPGASTNAVYNEVARVMEANHLPVNWSAPDPFEAARHIRPDMQLHT